MKTLIQRRALVRIALLFALIPAFALVYHAGYSSGNQSLESYDPIDAPTANQYYRNYYSTAPVTNAIVKGFSIDRSQYLAMGRLFAQNSGVAGFRVYFAKDNNGAPLGLVVGTDANGNDLTSIIFSTKAGQFESCPTVCDDRSAITKE